MHALCVVSNIITHQKMIYKDFIRIASKNIRVTNISRTALTCLNLQYMKKGMLIIITAI